MENTKQASQVQTETAMLVYNRRVSMILDHCLMQYSVSETNPMFEQRATDGTETSSNNKMTSKQSENQGHHIVTEPQGVVRYRMNTGSWNMDVTGLPSQSSCENMQYQENRQWNQYSAFQLN